MSVDEKINQSIETCVSFLYVSPVVFLNYCPLVVFVALTTVVEMCGNDSSMKSSMKLDTADMNCDKRCEF